MYKDNNSKPKQNTLKYSGQQLLLYLNTSSANDKGLFLKKQFADIFLIIKKTNKMYPLIARCINNNCGFFRAVREEKYIFIEENFKEEDMTNILSLMYGYSLILDRSKTRDYFEILQKLQFDYIIKMLKNDMLRNFQAYDIFILLELAHKYRLNDIMNRCQQELIKENFQQFRYNIFDLMQCPEDVFKTILIFHNQAKRQQIAKGLLYEQIIDIVQQYCSQNLTSNRGIILLTEIMGRKNPSQNMVSSKIQNPSLLCSFIQQPKLVQTKKIITTKSSTMYSQILADIQKSVHKTPIKNKQKYDLKPNFQQKVKFIRASKSPIGKNSFNSDCDSMVKTRLPTQSIALTNKKNSSKQKGTYKPWQAKRNHDNVLGSPKINKVMIPMHKNVSDRSPYAIEKRESVFQPFNNEKSKTSPRYMNKPRPTQISKTQSLTDKKIQICDAKINKFKQKFEENSISPMFQSLATQKPQQNKKQKQYLTTRQFLLTPTCSIKQVSQMDDSSYIEHTQILKKIQEVQVKPPPQTVNKIPKFRQKASIQFLINKTVRKNSYETVQMKMQPEYIPQYKKSPIMKEIQSLNRECLNIQQKNIKLMQEVKIIKNSFDRKEVQRKQYKQHLIQLDRVLHNLQKQFEVENQELIKISSKIEEYKQKDSSNDLIMASICQLIDNSF